MACPTALVKKGSPYLITEHRVTRQHRSCDLNPGPSATESSMLTTRLPSYCIGAGRKLSYSHRATHCCLYLHAVQLGTNESWEVKTNRLEMFLVLQPQLMSGWQPWRNRSVPSYQLLWLRQDSCSASVYHFRFNGRLADKSESTNQFCSCTHTHTCLTALFPGLPGWASTRKVKPIWILLEQETVSGSGISWAICKSALHSRQITMPVPHHCFFTGRMPFLPPNQQRQSNEGTSFVPVPVPE